MVSTISNNVDKTNVVLGELSKKVALIENKSGGNDSQALNEIQQKLSTIDKQLSSIEEIKTRIAKLENNRMLMESSILAKTEELVKRMVKEKVASEMSLVSNEMKSYINNMDKESDDISIAQSEITSLSQKKKSNKGNKNTLDIAV